MKKTALLCYFIFNSCFCFAQLQEKYPNNYTDKNYKGINYGFFKPDNLKEKKPLVIYLHGYQDTKSYDLTWYREYFQKENPCYVLTPKSLGGPPNTAWGNTLMNSLTPDFKTTMELINETIKNHNIDEDRIYIYGISMGGDGVYVALAEYPNKFAAAYVISGYGSAKKATKHAHVPLWIFHGSEDEVTPVDFSRNIANEIRKQPNNKVRYSEYKCVGHDSWVNVNKENTLNKWFFKQIRNHKFKKPGNVKKLSYFTGDRFWKRYIKWEKPNDRGYYKNKTWYYNLYKNGKLITQTDKLEFIDIDVSKKTSNYYVTIVNYYGIESNPSKTLTVE